jgi:hypothetical protein
MVHDSLWTVRPAAPCVEQAPSIEAALRYSFGSSISLKLRPVGLSAPLLGVDKLGQSFCDQRFDKFVTKYCVLPLRGTFPATELLL